MVGAWTQLCHLTPEYPSGPRLVAPRTQQALNTQWALNGWGFSSGTRAERKSHVPGAVTGALRAATACIGNAVPNSLASSRDSERMPGYIHCPEVDHFSKVTLATNWGTKHAKALLLLHALRVAISLGFF